MMPDRPPFSRTLLFTGLAAVLGLTCGCNPALRHMPKPPDPEEIEPFDPEKLELFYQLSPDQAENLIKNNRDVVIIDLRAPEDFAPAHLAGAINIPWPTDTYEAAAKKFDPGAKILICGYLSSYAIEEKGAMEAVKILRDADYRNLYWLTDGYPAWIQSGKPVVDMEGNVVENPPLGPMPEETEDPAAAAK